MDAAIENTPLRFVGGDDIDVVVNAAVSTSKGILTSGVVARRLFLVRIK